MCRRVAPLYGYYPGKAITIDQAGAGLDEYAWGPRKLKWFRCMRCGCFTHHFPYGRERDPDAKSDVNLRLADPAELAGVEVELQDGAADTWKVIKSHRFGE